MKVNRKVLSMLLVVLCLLSCCSFYSFAADDSLNIDDFSYLMGSKAEVDTGVTETLYYPVSYEDVTFKGVAMRGFYCEDTNFYDRDHTKILTVFEVTEVSPGHEYEMDFYTGINFNVSNIGYTVIVTVEGTEIFNRVFLTNVNKDHIKIKFTMPSSVTDSTTVGIEFSVPVRYSYGSTEGQKPRYYISREIGFVDTTDNPSWLGKILNKFSELGDTIGGFFDGLGDRIGGFFEEQKQKIQDFSNNVGQWFTDLGNNIKQWFIDLGEDIGEFFTMLKNYLLYFQHPVTTNSDGVLIGKDGKPVYTNPFESAIDKVKATVDDWLAKINNFVDGMETSRQDVTGYLENGSGVINTVLSASPILSVCVLFAVGFFVIRKVVGR